MRGGIDALIARQVEIEQAVARGIPNHRLMQRYHLTYEQLRTVVDGMVAEPQPRGRPHAVKGLQPHGSEAAWTRHRRHGEVPCDDCFDGHEERKLRRAESRRRSYADKHYRGVA